MNSTRWPQSTLRRRTSAAWKSRGAPSGIQLDMPDPATNETYTKHEGGKPNFGLVVLMAGGAFIVFFIVVWFVLHHSGRHFLPNNHPDHEPHACLQWPGLPSALHS